MNYLKSIFIIIFLFFRAADALVNCILAVDIRVRENYLLVFKEIFCHVKDYNHAMHYVYTLEHFKRTDNSVPDLKKYYKVY